MDQSKLLDLIALANEPSSERRRELLRSITDVFFANEVSPGAVEMQLYDDIMRQLAGEMESVVRVELAERFAEAEAAPVGLIRDLAGDESITVAKPVLEGSKALSEADLLMLAQTRSQDHLRAISQRSTVSEVVSGAIVQRGDDQTLGVLLRNQGAALSRESHEAVIDRAAENPELHEAVVGRESLPIDLLNDMYFMVEAHLRDQILQRNSEVDPAELDAALAAGRKKMAARDGALPPDFAEAEKHIQLLHAKRGVTPAVLAAFLRNRETTKFLVALAELASIDFHTARRILERRELDALSIVCKAAGFERSLYLTFAVLILDRDANAMARAREYGELYDELPRDTAQRTIRFWRLRRQTGDVAAA